MFVWDECVRVWSAAHVTVVVGAVRSSIGVRKCHKRTQRHTKGMIILPKSLPFHSGEFSPVRSLHFVNVVSLTCTCMRVCVPMMAMVRAQRVCER